MANRLKEIFTRLRIGTRPSDRADMPIVEKKDELVNQIEDLTATSGTALYQVGQLNQFRTLATDRQTMYKAFDDMKTDSVISAALEIYADNATQYDEQGRIIWVESDSDEITKAGNRLLKILEIPERAWKHIYQACLYGDCYLKLYRDNNFDQESDDKENFVSTTRVVNDKVEYKGHKDRPNYIEYVEDVNDPSTVFDLRKRGKTAGFIEVKKNEETHALLANSMNLSFGLQDISIYLSDRFVHVLISDTIERNPEEVTIDLGDGNQVTYQSAKGKSILQDVYPIQKELQLLEDTLLLNRLTRSPLIRLLEIELGDMPKKEVNAYLRRVKQLIEQHIAMDKDTGYYKSYNSPGPIDNILYIPVRNGKGSISVNNLGGDVNIRDIADVDYFNNKRAGALKIPKAYLGEDMEGCLRGDTKLLLLSGKHRTVKEMYDRREDYLGKGIMSCNEDGSLVPTKIKDIKLTRRNADFVRVHLDDGEYFDVTPDHLVMLRDGNFVPASWLEVGESLMPLYHKVSNGRRYVWDNKEETWSPQYRLVALHKYGELKKGYQVHHINSIKIDDDFDNLEQITFADHCSKHRRVLHERSQESREELKEKDPDAYYKKYGAGGRALKGCKKKKSTCEKISEALKGKPSNHPFEKGKNNPVFLMTDETHEKLSEAQQGRIKVNNGLEERSIKSEILDKFLEENPDFIVGVLPSRLENKRIERKARKEEKGSQFLQQWILEEHVCETCGKVMTEYYGSGRFCSRSCAATHPQSEESKQKIKDSKKSLTEETRHRMSEAQKNRAPVSEEARRSHSEAVKGDKNPCYGKKKVNDGKQEKFVPKEELEKFLLNNQEWSLGGLKKKAPYNHKVVKVEYLEGIIEDAYDIEVENESHTFILDAGVFVHNSGLSNGGSLTRLSYQFARTIKRIQTAYIRAIKTLLNLFFIDKKLDYVNKFEVRMTSPSTQEDLERNELVQGNVGLISDIMDLTESLEGNTQKKILNYLVANVLRMPEIAEMIEEDETPSEEIDIEGGGGGGFAGPDLGGPNEPVDMTAEFEGPGGSESGPAGGESPENGFSEEEFSEFTDL